MSLTVLPFPGRRGAETDEVTISPEPSSGVLSDATAMKTHALIDLGGIRGVYTERFPPSKPKLRVFFETLAKRRVFYIVQVKDGDLLGTDRIYVLVFDDKDEVPGKLWISVASFYKYTATDPTIDVNLGDYIAMYAATHRYMIDGDDEDPANFDNIEHIELREIPDFRPEKIPMIDLDDDDGYDYEVIEVLGEVRIPARNFIIREDYCPPLLHLLIEAADHIDYLEHSDRIIQVAKYSLGPSKSRMLVMSYEEFLELIDASILRSYPLLSAKYDTPEKRRAYIHEKFVVPNLDPKLIGGQASETESD